MSQQNEQDYSMPYTVVQAKKEVSLIQLFRILWQGKLIIIACLLVCSIAGVALALSLPDRYAAQTKLAPTEESQNSLSGMSQLGGLASLAGVQLPQGQTDKATVAYEVLISREFLSDFIERRDLFADILAVDHWNSSTGELVYNTDLYDPANESWVAMPGGRESQTEPGRPSTWLAVDEMRKHLFISKDDVTGFVTINVNHLSPIVAQQWVAWLIEDINDRIRARDVAEARRSTEFLERELETTSLATMQQIFYQLMEQQTQTIMMANVRPEYVFQVLDPPMVSEDKASPARALICIGFFILGGFTGLLIVYLRHAIQEEHKRDLNP